MKTKPDLTFYVLVAALAASFACRSAMEAEASVAGAPEETPKPQTAPALPSELVRNPMSIADVAERAVPSVVNIAVRKTPKARRAPRGRPPLFDDPRFRDFFGPPRGFEPSPPPAQRGQGSGVIVRAEGIVLTNNHVVDGADEVTVTLHGGQEVKAEIVGTDPATDLAVLRLQSPPDDLVALPLGDSDALRLGEVVVAIGNPFGVGQTVTMGIVSAKGRGNMGIVDYEDFIQTDAAINPGNSGGALLNLRGELVGINTAILSRSGGSQGVGFAIPTKLARGVFESLLDKGRVVRGFLGVMIQDLTPDLASAMQLDRSDGVLVSDVVDGSPAQAAGLEPRDVIIEVDGRPVKNASKLRNQIASLGAHREVVLTTLRDGERQQVTVELAEKDAGPGAEAASERAEGALGGLSVAPLTPERRREFRVAARIERGVVITEVEPGSAAAQAGLRRGDVVLGVGRVAVPDVDAFTREYGRAKGAALLRVFRDGGTLFVVLNK